MRKLIAQPLTAERFAAFGDVIESSDAARVPMNNARFDRSVGLAAIEVGHGKPCVSIARCRTPTAIPYCVDMLERHPNGSQAFVPLTGFSFLVVVAPPAEFLESDDVKAFISNGRQGINYRPGVWHMPMVALEEGQEFLVLDRDGAACEERHLDTSILVSL